MMEAGMGDSKSSSGAWQRLKIHLSVSWDRRLLLWMAGLSLGLLAAWFVWTSLENGWLIGILFGGAWLMNILIHVAFIDYLLRRSAQFR